MSATPLSTIEKIHDRAQRAFRAGNTKSIPFRKAQLAQLGYMVKDNEQRFMDALKHDLGRPDMETILLEFVPFYHELRLAYDCLESWTAPQKGTDTHQLEALSTLSCTMVAEPKGVVLFITPFNVPLAWPFRPLISAIAGGNAVVMKPSAQSVHMNSLLKELIPRYLHSDLYQVVIGGHDKTMKVVELHWDHILYIGSQDMGRLVSQAAAKHLIPLTLELGGKSPVIIDPNTDLQLAVKRILWGRFANAGQICLAPEYILVQENFQDILVEVIKEVYHTFYPEGPAESPCFARIISEAHSKRLERLISATQGTIILGGDVDVTRKYVSPTVVINVKGDDSLMSEELFGPILLLLPVKDVDEAISFINSRDHPLAVFVFSEDIEFQNKVFTNTKSGAAVANDTVLFGSVPGFPFGGIGPSGYGYSGGKQGFEQFIHYRIFLDSPKAVDDLGLECRYPPYKPTHIMTELAPALPARPDCPAPSAYL